MFSFRILVMLALVVFSLPAAVAEEMSLDEEVVSEDEVAAEKQVPSVEMNLDEEVISLQMTVADVIEARCVADKSDFFCPHLGLAKGLVSKLEPCGSQANCEVQRQYDGLYVVIFVWKQLGLAENILKKAQLFCDQGQKGACELGLASAQALVYSSQALEPYCTDCAKPAHRAARLDKSLAPDEQVKVLRGLIEEIRSSL